MAGRALPRSRARRRCQRRFQPPTSPLPERRRSPCSTSPRTAGSAVSAPFPFTVSAARRGGEVSAGHFRQRGRRSCRRAERSARDQLRPGATSRSIPRPRILITPAAVGNIFVRDTCVGAANCRPKTVAVDLAPDGSAPNGKAGRQVAISGDGRFVASFRERRIWFPETRSSRWVSGNCMFVIFASACKRAFRMRAAH